MCRIIKQKCPDVNSKILGDQKQAKTLLSYPIKAISLFITHCKTDNLATEGLSFIREMKDWGIFSNNPIALAQLDEILTAKKGVLMVHEKRIQEALMLGIANGKNAISSLPN